MQIEHTPVQIDAAVDHAVLAHRTGHADANAQNLLDGIPDDNDPNSYIPRYEMAQMLYNAAKAKGMDVSPTAEFYDSDRSYGEAYDTAIGYAYATGLLDGKGDDVGFAGVQNLNRAEAATVVWRFYTMIHGGVA